MRFVLRAGSGLVARADVAMLSAIGLPGGGVVRVGDTQVRVVPAEMARPNELLLPPDAFTNGAGTPGSAVDVNRIVVPPAATIRLEGPDGALDTVPRDLLTVPVRAGETYSPAGVAHRIVAVQPAPCATVAPSTVAVLGPPPVPSRVEEPAGVAEEPPDTGALTTGLENELELLTGWLRLLTGDVPAPGNGRAAGVIITGPPGSGRSQLVDAAVAAAKLRIEHIDLRTVTTPDRLLASFERAVKSAPRGTVLFVDRLDPLLEREGGIRHQAAAVTRWMLDAVADREGLAVVIVSARSGIADELDARDLLPKTLTVAPPGHARRRALLAAVLPDAVDLDLDTLANATPGFSALDISSAALDARARADGPLTTELVLEAIHATPASLGTTTLGSIPSYGFDRVANLTDVKQALTESVIWQFTDPDRFVRMGIEPPRGMLLYGPPGTGKTFVVRALAHESGAAFFSIKGAELLDKWVGESERGVREVFARARSVAPAIIFFDELDALAPVRGSSTTNVTDSVVAALLTELDGVSSLGDVFVIGATNRRDLIDPALLRPGRLEVHLLLDLPSPEARAAFFSMTTVPLDPSVDRDRLVDDTDGMSFADLDAVLRRAAIAAMRSDPHAAVVTAEHLAAALRGGD